MKLTWLCSRRAAERSRAAHMTAEHPYAPIPIADIEAAVLSVPISEYEPAERPLACWQHPVLLWCALLAIKPVACCCMGSCVSPLPHTCLRMGGAHHDGLQLPAHQAHRQAGIISGCTLTPAHLDACTAQAGSGRAELCSAQGGRSSPARRPRDPRGLCGAAQESPPAGGRKRARQACQCSKWARQACKWGGQACQGAAVHAAPARCAHSRDAGLGPAPLRCGHVRRGGHTEHLSLQHPAHGVGALGAETTSMQRTCLACHAASCHASVTAQPDAGSGICLGSGSFTLAAAVWGLAGCPTLQPAGYRLACLSLC